MVKTQIASCIFSPGTRRGDGDYEEVTWILGGSSLAQPGLSCEFCENLVTYSDL